MRIAAGFGTDGRSWAGRLTTRSQYVWQGGVLQDFLASLFVQFRIGIAVLGGNSVHQAAGCLEQFFFVTDMLEKFEILAHIGSVTPPAELNNCPLTCAPLSSSPTSEGGSPARHQDVRGFSGRDSARESWIGWCCRIARPSRRKGRAMGRLAEPHMRMS